MPRTPSKTFSLPKSALPPREIAIITMVLVLYYSSYGHIEAMAKAVAEGAKSAGAEFDIVPHYPSAPG